MVIVVSLIRTDRVSGQLSAGVRSRECNGVQVRYRTILGVIMFKAPVDGNDPPSARQSYC